MCSSPIKLKYSTLFVKYCLFVICMVKCSKIFGLVMGCYSVILLWLAFSSFLANNTSHNVLKLFQRAKWHKHILYSGTTVHNIYIIPPTLLCFQLLYQVARGHLHSAGYKSFYAQKHNFKHFNYLSPTTCTEVCIPAFTWFQYLHLFSPPGLRKAFYYVHLSVYMSIYWLWGKFPFGITSIYSNCLLWHYRWLFQDYEMIVIVLFCNSKLCWSRKMKMFQPWHMASLGILRLNLIAVERKTLK